jgi:DNA-binding NarL/FixJ family response regulator
MIEPSGLTKRYGSQVALSDLSFTVEPAARLLERVAAGGTALDPQVVTQLLSARGAVSGLKSLTARERDVLALMAEGRSNAAIAGAIWAAADTRAPHVRTWQAGS